MSWRPFTLINYTSVLIKWGILLTGDKRKSIIILMLVLKTNLIRISDIKYIVPFAKMKTATIKLSISSNQI